MKNLRIYGNDSQLLHIFDEVLSWDVLGSFVHLRLPDNGRTLNYLLNSKDIKEMAWEASK